MQHTTEQASALGGVVRAAWNAQKWRRNGTSGKEAVDD